MANTFFSINGPEEYQEITAKWLKLTRDEIRNVSAGKSRVYLSVEDMDLIQDGFQAFLVTANLTKAETRKLMQMGYALEEIKVRLKKRIEREAK